MARSIEIRRILCPTDFSEPSRRALEHAVAVGRWYGAGIAVLHVVAPPLPLGVGFPAPLPAAGAATDLEAVREALRDFARPAAQAGLNVETVAAEGAAVLGILEQAQSLPADLLVMGTHGRGGFVGWALGSVTEKVLRRAPCPVLSVRPAEPAEAPGGSAPLFRRILCPVDFSPSSERALAYALSLAQEADSRITLLHVLEWPAEEPSQPARFSVEDYRQVLAAEAKERLRALVPDAARNWCEPEEAVVLGKAHREILRLAKERQSDLIVMGVQGRGALDLALFGSTTHHVVRGASCPVLAIRGEG
jgi:nucleotide-binding universal stress UspA family protein